MEKDLLVIIPARGGSKGIPKKNIKDFCGRPLLHYTIDVARKIADDEHIILSTDSDEIIDCAKSTGLKVPYRRPSELASDQASTRDAILDAMDFADKNNISYSKICLLQPTSPLRTVADVEECLKLYNAELDLVTTIVDADTNPYFNCYEINPETGYMHISKGDGCIIRRQDAPEAFQFNGAVYIINPRSIRQTEIGAMKKRIGHKMDKIRSVDLDTPLDWAIAETVMRELKDNSNEN
ncbi:MAG: acylneuraminate cytidylyltransferase family protein [Paramuribaculum sp.]|nr:acylneuraminate cytidylyltransferase family protein [Paramuribaculum sp.]